MLRSIPKVLPWRWLVLSIGCILIDQVTKNWAVSTLTNGEEVSILPGVIFYLCYNPGIGFGLLANQNLSFGIMALATFMLFDIAHRFSHHKTPPNGLVYLSLSLILGGGISNIYDRYQLGVVVDFIGLHLFKYKGPVFNLADLFISVGFVLVIVSEFAYEIKRQKVSS